MPARKAQTGTGPPPRYQQQFSTGSGTTGITGIKQANRTRERAVRLVGLAARFKQDRFEKQQVSAPKSALDQLAGDDDALDLVGAFGIWVILDQRTVSAGRSRAVRPGVSTDTASSVGSSAVGYPFSSAARSARQDA
jgi:hypothetical protein